VSTVAPAFRRPSCGQENNPRLAPSGASTTCLPVQLGQVHPAMQGVQPLVGAPASTVATVPHGTSAALPDRLSADLVKLNGGQPVTTSLAGLVGELRELLADAHEKLYDVAEVLEEHDYPDARCSSVAGDRPLAEAVRNAMGSADECRAVRDVLTNAGFGAWGQSLPDAVEELVLLATEGEEAYAMLLEADYMTESHRVRDALKEALAAAQARAARQVPGAHGFVSDSRT